MIRTFVGASLCVLVSIGTARGNGYDGVPNVPGGDASLTGRIITDAGPPARPMYVVVFAADRALWLPQTSRITAGLTDFDGRWIVQGLPAGEYRVAIVTSLVAGELSDPLFLRRVTPASTKVTLAEGEKKTLDLRLESGF